MRNQIPVTVIVPTKNEEKNLARCLGKLGRFDDVIVVDSKSTDATCEIAKKHGVAVLQFEWNGQYPKKRNWVLLNHRFSTEWVLFLDADEFVDDAFCDAVAAAVGDDNHNGYWLNYRNYFLGRELKYGLRQRKLALFEVGSGLYERIDETWWSKLDMEVHEHPIIKGDIGEIKATIDHKDYQGIRKFLERHQDYAKWESNRFLLLKKAGKIPGEKLTSRQNFKYKNIERWWFPWFYFIYCYFIKFGFLDGTAGFYYAFYKAGYFLTVRLLIMDNRTNEDGA